MVPDSVEYWNNVLSYQPPARLRLSTIRNFRVRVLESKGETTLSFQSCGILGVLIWSMIQADCRFLDSRLTRL